MRHNDDAATARHICNESFHIEMKAHCAQMALTLESLQVLNFNYHITLNWSVRFSFDNLKMIHNQINMFETHFKQSKNDTEATCLSATPILGCISKRKNVHGK